MIELNLRDISKNGDIQGSSALYVDVLKSPSCLSLCLQDDHLDIVSGIKSVLKSSKSLQSTAELDPLQWQVPILVLGLK